jgi:hypothetical protein
MKTRIGGIFLIASGLWRICLDIEVPVSPS